MHYHYAFSFSIFRDLQDVNGGEPPANRLISAEQILSGINFSTPNYWINFSILHSDAWVERSQLHKRACSWLVDIHMGRYDPISGSFLVFHILQIFFPSEQKNFRFVDLNG